MSKKLKFEGEKIIKYSLSHIVLLKNNCLYMFQNVLLFIHLKMFKIGCMLNIIYCNKLCVALGRSSQILKSNQCNPLICDIKEGHKASTQTKFH